MVQLPHTLGRQNVPLYTHGGRQDFTAHTSTPTFHPSGDVEIPRAVV